MEFHRLPYAFSPVFGAPKGDARRGRLPGGQTKPRRAAWAGRPGNDSRCACVPGRASLKGSEARVGIGKGTQGTLPCADVRTVFVEKRRMQYAARVGRVTALLPPEVREKGADVQHPRMCL